MDLICILWRKKKIRKISRAIRIILSFNIHGNNFLKTFTKEEYSLSWKYVEIEVLEIRIDARRQRRAKLSRSRSPRHLARFLTRNRTSIPRNSPRILATFPPLSPYVPNRGEDKLLSTLWRNREIFARAIQVRRITNEKAVFVEYEIEKFFNGFS